MNIDIRKINFNKEFSISNKKIIGLHLIIVLVMSSCSSITKSTFLGISTGLTIGASAGAVVNNHNRGQAVLTSALIMGVIGGAFGYFGHQELEDRDASVRKDTLFNLEKYGVSGYSNNIRPITKEGDK